jgi:hypothetical protein
MSEAKKLMISFFYQIGKLELKLGWKINGLADKKSDIFVIATNLA